MVVHPVHQDALVHVVQLVKAHPQATFVVPVDQDAPLPVAVVVHLRVVVVVHQDAHRLVVVVVLLPVVVDAHPHAVVDALRDVLLLVAADALRGAPLLVAVDALRGAPLLVAVDALRGVHHLAEAVVLLDVHLLVEVDADLDVAPHVIVNVLDNVDGGYVVICVIIPVLVVMGNAMDTAQVVMVLVVADVTYLVEDTMTLSRDGENNTEKPEKPSSE